ncbi:hypothetical protein ACJX0J_020649, partial [Zea mays]
MQEIFRNPKKIQPSSNAVYILAVIYHKPMGSMNINFSEFQILSCLEQSSWIHHVPDELDILSCTKLYGLNKYFFWSQLRDLKLIYLTWKIVHACYIDYFLHVCSHAGELTTSSIDGFFFIKIEKEIKEL